MSFLKTLKMQLYVLFTRKFFLITFVVLFLVNINSFLDKMMDNNGVDKYFQLPSSFAFILNTHFGGRAFISIVAILAAIPFCTSYAEDHKANLCPTIFTRTSSYNYYFAKLTAVFISTFVCIAIPFIINQLLCMSFFPIDNITCDPSLGSSHGYNLNMVMASYAFKNIFVNNIHLYDFIYTMIFSAFWGIVAVFSCAVSFCLTKLKAIVILIPMLLSLIATFLESLIAFDTTTGAYSFILDFGDFILPQSFALNAWPQVFIAYIIGFIALSVLLVKVKVKAERVKAK